MAAFALPDTSFFASISWTVRFGASRSHSYGIKIAVILSEKTIDWSNRSRNHGKQALIACRSAATGTRRLARRLDGSGKCGELLPRHRFSRDVVPPRKDSDAHHRTFPL